jgi:hypothetical protein
VKQQGIAYRSRRDPAYLRWLIAGLLGVILFGFILFLFLPRLVGGLLGRGEAVSDSWAGAEWDMEAVIWEPRDETSGEQLPLTGPEPITPDEVMLESSQDLVLDLLAEQEALEREIILPAAGTGGTPDQVPPSSSTGSGAPRGEERLSPRVIFQEWPDPTLIRKLNESGSFHFRLRVDPHGLVTTYQLLKGFDCDACLTEARRIIASLRFMPGTEAGFPVACWVQYEIEFRRDGE